MMGNSWYVQARPNRAHLTTETRAILHDESRYSNADAFDPSRFLDAKGRLDRSIPEPVEAFGFGRRVCPGRHFVMDAAWIAIAHMLAVFSIEKPLDDSGNAIEPSGKYSSGSFRYAGILD